MTAKEAITNLRSTGATEPIEYFLYLADHHEARLADGQRLNDLTDFAAWLRELAEAASPQPLSLAPVRICASFKGPRFVLGPVEVQKLSQLATCPRCGHIHQGEEECGMFMGASAGFCRCEEETTV